MNLRTLLVVTFAILAPGRASVAADRLALVIGNGGYSKLLPLDDCPRDAELMVETFTKCGIKVHGGRPLKNLTLDQMDEAVRQFVGAIPAGAEVYLFYSGHGAQIEGVNYLLPVDFDAQFQTQVKRKALSLDDILVQLEGSRAALRVVVLDSCRDPGHLLPGEPPQKSLGARKGLAEQHVDAPETLVCFATKHGTPSFASGDDDPYSFYTGVLAREMVKPGNVEDVLKRVARGVYEKTGQQQLPFTYGSLLNDHFFVEGGAAPSLSPSPPRDPVGGATRERPYVNTLGMEFIPLPGQAGVLMCRTETRVRDFRAYARAADYVQTGGAYVLKVKGDAKAGYSTTWELDTLASWEKPGFAQSEEHAVCCVSLDEAEAFCAWLSKQEGKKYRLPTDAEWSAAVGVGKYPWGSAWPPPKGAGNYAGTEWAKDLPKANWAVAYEYSDGQARTGPVGSFEENRNGFYDLGGNVWEWCSDRYRSSMNSAEVLEEIPALKEETASDGTPYRVLRGGSWFSVDPSALLSSDRYNDPPGARGDDRGFRVVLVVGSGG